MNVDQAYAKIRNSAGDSTEALKWALEHWEEASDRLLSKLRALCAKLPAEEESPEYLPDDAYALFTVAHLFAEKRDVRAYAPLCDRMARDKGVSPWLGDAPETTLNGVLINLYDGDLEPIQDLIERAEGDEGVRSAAFEAFAYLVRVQSAASDDEARGFLLKLLREARPREADPIWTDWALAVARLGFAELGSEVARLFSKSWIADPEMSLQEYHRVLAQARADPAAAFAEAGIAPFGSTVELLADYQLPSADDGGYLLGEDIPEEGPEQPHVNPMRDVGRNDPCPCGSGKKFKKCCLAA